MRIILLNRDSQVQAGAAESLILLSQLHKFLFSKAGIANRVKWTAQALIIRTSSALDTYVPIAYEPLIFVLDTAWMVSLEAVPRVTYAEVVPAVLANEAAFLGHLVLFLPLPLHAHHFLPWTRKRSGLDLNPLKTLRKTPGSPSPPRSSPG